MKRIISFVLVLIMVLGLASCFAPIDPNGSTASNIPTFPTEKPTTNPTNPSNPTNPTNPANPTQPGSSSTRPTGSTGSNPTTPSSGTTGSTVPVNPIDPPVIDSEEMEVYAALFDPTSHVSMKLDISNEELKKIQQDYEHYRSFGSKSPIYRMADLYVTITKANGEKMEFVIEQVGVRMKGNTSRTDFYNDHDGMYNLVHFKISFGETFDDVEYYGSDALVWASTDARKARKNRTFATLEKIDIRWNRNDDPTYIREIYAYDLYRENGVLAPHTNLASVDIGNDHAGVWVFYEPIDKIFLEKYLPEEALGGDLYKLGWTSDPADFTRFHSYGAEDEDKGQFYVYDIKTNKKTTDHSSLKNLINTLNSSGLTKEQFSSVVDIENFINYCAVSYIIGNPDDLRNNYNNTYIYFRPDTGKVLFIPYDMDRGLGVNSWNPYGNGMTTDSPFQNWNCGGDQRNPLFKKTIHKNGFFVNEYVEAIKRVDAHEMLTNEAFEERFNIARNLYSDDVSTSRNYHNANDYKFHFDINQSCNAGASSCMSFADYMRLKRETMAKYISGYVPVPDDSENSGEQGGNTDNQTKEWDLYLRGNFNNNNWSNQSQYKFKHVGDGVYSVDVSCGNDLFKFKVYNDKQSGDEAWYNQVDEEKTTAWFEYQGDHANVQVKAGSYTVYFDTNTETLYVVEK